MKMKQLVCAFLALALLLGACPALAENPILDLTDDRYATSEQVIAVMATAEAINTVKSGIFGANNGYRAGGYGIYNEETRTFNEDMLEAIRNSGVTHIRQPGGTEGDYFHWYETVGSVEERIAQINPFSSHHPTYAEKDGELYDVVFGPDEWIELCNLTGTSLTIQLNAGTGTPQEAADFIRYCLDKGVEIESIAVGNESCMEEERVEGITVTKTPDEYVAFYNEVLACMGEEMIAELDEKGIPFGCIGLPSSHVLSIHRKWDDTVLANVNVAADFIDIHIGYSPFSVNLDGLSAEQIHKTLLATHTYVKKLLDMEVKTINKYSPDTLIKMSEFGPLGNSATCYGTAGSLYLASFFHTVLAQPKVFSADYLPLTPGNSALICNGEMTTPGHIFKMYSGLIGYDVLAVASENSRTFKAQASGLIPRLLNVPEGDGAVYFNAETGKGSLILINRAYTDNTVFDVTLPWANAKITKVTELWNEDYSQRLVTPAEVACDVQPAEGKFSVAMKPVSLVWIDFVIE